MNIIDLGGQFQTKLDMQCILQDKGLKSTVALYPTVGLKLPQLPPELFINSCLLFLCGGSEGWVLGSPARLLEGINS